MGIGAPNTSRTECLSASVPGTTSTTRIPGSIADTTSTVALVTTADMSTSGAALAYTKENGSVVTTVSAIAEAEALTAPVNSTAGKTSVATAVAVSTVGDVPSVETMVAVNFAAAGTGRVATPDVRLVMVAGVASGGAANRAADNVVAIPEPATTTVADIASSYRKTDLLLVNLNHERLAANPAGRFVLNPVLPRSNSRSNLANSFDWV